jgi:hypothetical protein
MTSPGKTDSWSWYLEECLRCRGDNVKEKLANATPEKPASITGLAGKSQKTPLSSSVVLLLTIALGSAVLATTEAQVQFRYGARGGGFGYLSGRYTPPPTIGRIAPSGGWRPILRGLPGPVYRGVQQGRSGIPTILFYPQRAY